MKVERGVLTSEAVNGQLGCILVIMAKIVGSILHGAYGDLYEQALCLKHYAATHPRTELRLFAATPVRLEAFQAVDLSFAASFELWTAIESQPEIDHFYQFQVHDAELREDVLDRLSPECRGKFDLKTNHLPWDYMRMHNLIPEREKMSLPLSGRGKFSMEQIISSTGLPENIWMQPTVSFLWRYRKGSGAINSFGQKSEQEMKSEYSGIFRNLIDKHGCHVLVFGMNLVTDDSNRARTDNKYAAFGLDLPSSNVTYFKGMSWPVELEIASAATVCCGHASGFTEGMWLKRGGDMVLMDAPPHYLAKAAYHGMPFFELNQPQELIGGMLNRSAAKYEQKIGKMLSSSEPLRRRGRVSVSVAAFGDARGVRRRPYLSSASPLCGSSIHSGSPLRS